MTQHHFESEWHRMRTFLTMTKPPNVVRPKTMITDIIYDKPTERLARGRNGYFRMAGIQIYQNPSGEIELTAINGKGKNSEAARLIVSPEKLDDLINALYRTRAEIADNM